MTGDGGTLTRVEAAPEDVQEELVLIYVTVPSEDVAALLARSLVTSRLVACVNVLGPLRSYYEWQGVFEEATEFALLIKTRASRTDRTMAALLEEHPYDCPAIDVIPVKDAPRAFRAWVAQQTTDLKPSPGA